MQIVTATAAKNIATNFEGNPWRPFIEKIMADITRTAIKGGRKLDIKVTLENFSLENALTLITFFKGLGYETSDWRTNENLYVTLAW